MAFLTLEDPNAKIKGSRDPLGMVPIWTRFARHVVTNLTTPSGSTRGFTVLLLGRYFTSQLIESGQIPREEALNVVLRMEQLGAYARHVGYGVESDIRGIERVKAFIREGKGSVTIQANKKGMILADQKVYGLWGLFSVPARTSGLIPEGSIGVTKTTKIFIENNYMPVLEPVVKPLLAILAEGGRLNLRKQPVYFKALTSVLSEKYTPEEVEFYGASIRDAHDAKQNHNQRQGLFSKLLIDMGYLEYRTDREEILHLSELAHRKDKVLGHSLQRIADLEAILAPADALFSYILMHHNQSVDKVAKNLSEVWGRRVPYLGKQKLNELLPEIMGASTEDTGAALSASYLALGKGKYAEAIDHLLYWNQTVMLGRRSAPWVKIGENGRLDIRYRGADQLLPNQAQLHSLWRNSYFIDSLKRVTRQLMAVA